MAICVVKGSSLHSLKYFVHYDIKCFAYLNILNVGILQLQLYILIYVKKTQEIKEIILSWLE